MNPYDQTGTPLRHEEARRKLLEEGAKSYVDALTAIVAYQREVQEKCRDVLARNLADYSRSLGLEPANYLTQGMIDDHAYPDLKQWDGDTASLGVKMKGTSWPGLSWWWTLCYLYWDSGERDTRWFGVVVELRLPKRAAAALHTAMVLYPSSEVYLEGYSVWIQRKLCVSGSADFEGDLEELLGSWIEVLGRVDGLRAILAAASQASEEEEGPGHPTGLS
jgi:hypothetical protein